MMADKSDTEIKIVMITYVDDPICGNSEKLC